MRQLWKPADIVADQHGGLGYALFWVMFVIILLIPFQWDVAGVFYARRVAGTGADAAALAAAREVAGRLQRTAMTNGVYRGICGVESSPQQVVLRYVRDPAFLTAQAIVGPSAHRYAAANNTTLTRVHAWNEYSGLKAAAGVPVPVIKVHAGVRRPVHTVYAPIYRRAFSMQNQAQAVAYLHRSWFVPRPCGPKVPPTYDFSFEWKITLDARRR